jgi:hypothetical protein
MAPEPVKESWPYSASEFGAVYKIPIEFAMLEIINFVISEKGRLFHSCDRVKEPSKRGETFTLLAAKIRIDHQGAGRG